MDQVTYSPDVDKRDILIKDLVQELKDIKSDAMSLEQGVSETINNWDRNIRHLVKTDSDFDSDMVKQHSINMENDKTSAESIQSRIDYFLSRKHLQ